MDFGFIRASTPDYTGPNLATDRVVESYDWYVAYLIIVDEATKYVWIFLQKSKEPPTDLVSHFLQMFGRKGGGVIRCDQGGELARSHLFRTELLEKHLYVVEPTGADSPSQNGVTERWNDTLAVTTRALLYGAALPAKYWLAALIHAAYVHNRRVHSGLLSTPYEHWFDHHPCLRNLRVFGSRVCVKHTGTRRAKLDKHDFTGIFIGYTATDSNICYIDVNSGQVKTSHHAVFDECWFHQQWRPPAAQLLYDLGIQLSGSTPPPPPAAALDLDDANSIQPIHTPQSLRTPDGSLPAHPPALIEDDSSQASDDDGFTDVLPFRAHTTTSLPSSSTSRPDSSYNIYPNNRDAVAVDHYDITCRDLAQVYFSPHCFGHTFEAMFTYHWLPSLIHPTAGLILSLANDRVMITSIAPSTPCAKIPRWRTRLTNTWLTHINDTPVESIDHAIQLFEALPHTPHGTCHFTIVSLELRDGLTHEGIPQLTLDQLNP
jgi:hypothetical protein